MRLGDSQGALVKRTRRKECGRAAVFRQWLRSRLARSGTSTRNFIGQTPPVFRANVVGDILEGAHATSFHVVDTGLDCRKIGNLSVERLSHAQPG